MRSVSAAYPTSKSSLLCTQQILLLISSGITHTCTQRINERILIAVISIIVVCVRVSVCDCVHAREVCVCNAHVREYMYKIVGKNGRAIKRRLNYVLRDSVCVCEFLLQCTIFASAIDDLHLTHTPKITKKNLYKSASILSARRGPDQQKNTHKSTISTHSCDRASKLPPPPRAPTRKKEHAKKP